MTLPIYNEKKRLLLIKVEYCITTQQFSILKDVTVEIDFILGVSLKLLCPDMVICLIGMNKRICVNRRNPRIVISQLQ